jgi:hypothetical protein
MFNMFSLHFVSNHESLFFPESFILSLQFVVGDHIIDRDGDLG